MSTPSIEKSSINGVVKAEWTNPDQHCGNIGDSRHTGNQSMCHGVWDSTYFQHTCSGFGGYKEGCVITNLTFRMGANGISAITGAEYVPLNQINDAGARFSSTFYCGTTCDDWNCDGDYKYTSTTLTNKKPYALEMMELWIACKIIGVRMRFTNPLDPTQPPINVSIGSTGGSSGSSCDNGTKYEVIGPYSWHDKKWYFGDIYAVCSNHCSSGDESGCWYFGVQRIVSATFVALDCNPPCSQGYICKNGTCITKPCAPPCTGGKICIDSVCQKPPPPPAPTPPPPPPTEWFPPGFSADQLKTWMHENPVPFWSWVITILFVLYSLLKSN